MKITVEFLSLPAVTKIVGDKSITLEFPGRTIDDLLTLITDRYGQKVRNFLFDDSGKLDMMLKILLNGSQWIRRDQLDKPLENGDRITIMMLVAGG
jgi:MoaD family protein